MPSGPTRNLYLWMGVPRLRGYQHRSKQTYDTEFDRWLQKMDWNCREAATELDIPYQRVRDLRAGWCAGQLNGGILPSIMTRYAMAALAAGIQPVHYTADCYDLRDRLAQAAHDAGLEPWPAGIMPERNPDSARKRPLEAVRERAAAGVAPKPLKPASRPRFDRSIHEKRPAKGPRKNVLVPKG